MMDKRYSISQAFDIIGKENLTGNHINHSGRKKSIVVDGYNVYARSLRYMTFYQKGVKCACCNREGSYFKLDGDVNTNRRHFNLYSEDGVLMTKDHIVPKSLGGMDIIDNMQTMCADCNFKKGNGIDEEYKIISINKEGNIKKYTTISNAVINILNSNGNDSKKSEKYVENVIETADMIRYAIKNKTEFRGRRWYAADDIK